MPNSPGPRARSSAAATKQALLDSARDEFAEHGIAGARVDRIAKRAGVNKERIYGYFGNKEKLFDAVMKAAMDELVEVTAMPGDNPVDYVGKLFDYYVRNPVLLRLLLWESLYHRTNTLPEQQWRVDRCRQKVVSLADRLGEEPSDEIGRTVLTLKGLALMPMVMPQIAALFGASMDTPESIAQMREHVMAFARTAMENRTTAE
ncbi:TetR/AcrR family transcriptional regulator [Actinomadura meridiana]